MEVWNKVPIEGYEFYEVSNHGNVRNTKTGRLLKDTDHKGYRCVTLSNDTKRLYVTIHRLVAMAFLDNPKNLPSVNHIDCNKSNNHVSNLEWCTQSENLKHSWLKGTTKFTENMRRAATRTIMAEVEKQKRSVVCMLNDKVLATYESASNAARLINGSQAHISDCCNGKRKHHKGYSWKWASM